MTEGTAVQAQVASVKRQAGIILLLVFLAGLLVGMAADRLWLTRHWGREGGRPRMMGGGPFGRGGPRGPGMPGMGPAMSPEAAAERREWMIKRLTRELDLTSAQQKAIDSIMASNEAEFQAIEQEMRPRMRAFLDRSRAQIDSVLTPEQQEQFRRFGPRGGPPGGPPPPGDDD